MMTSWQYHIHRNFHGVHISCSLILVRVNFHVSNHPWLSLEFRKKWPMHGSHVYIGMWEAAVGGILCIREPRNNATNVQWLNPLTTMAQSLGICQRCYMYVLCCWRDINSLHTVTRKQSCMYHKTEPSLHFFGHVAIFSCINYSFWWFCQFNF